MKQGAAMTDEDQERIDELLHAAEELGQREITMPIDIFSLARNFADMPDASGVFAAVREPLLGHRNAFVRRVFFAMARFMEGADLPETDLADAVLTGLGDSSAWVQYDAAWLAMERRIPSPAVVAKLRKLARGDKRGRKIDPGDARANLHRQAAEALAALCEK
jgi:hypothetical protein